VTLTKDQQALGPGVIHEEPTLLRMLNALLDGLDLVHKAGFIHRDIKPDNIYLCDDGSPVLLDFSSARRAVGVETRTLIALVTPGYAPFEQYDGSRDAEGRQGPWTDIYAMGATMYRVVTGKGPPDAMARVYAVLNGSDYLIPAAVAARSGYSASFLHAVDAALSYRPEVRPQSVEQWRTLLNAAPSKPAGVEQGTDQEFSEAPTLRLDSRSVQSIDVPTSRPRRWSRWVATTIVLTTVAGGSWLRWRENVPDVMTPMLESSQDSSAATRIAQPTNSQETARLAAEQRKVAQAVRLAEEEREVEAAARLALEQREALQNARVTALLKHAREASAARRLTSPLGNNVVEYYRQVQAIEPANQEAQSGFDDVARIYVKLAQREIAQLDFASAGQFLDREDTVVKDFPAVVDARESLSKAQAAERDHIETAKLAELKSTSSISDDAVPIVEDVPVVTPATPPAHASSSLRVVLGPALGNSTWRNAGHQLETIARTVMGDLAKSNIVRDESFSDSPDWRGFFGGMGDSESLRSLGRAAGADAVLVLELDFSEKDFNDITAFAVSVKSGVVHNARSAGDYHSRVPSMITGVLEAVSDE
jgi:hypothetical protein